MISKYISLFNETYLFVNGNYIVIKVYYYYYILQEFKWRKFIKIKCIIIYKSNKQSIIKLQEKLYCVLIV